MHPALLVLTLLALILVVALWQRQRALRREAHIRAFELPRGLFDKLRQRQPHLSLKDCQLVAQALRQSSLAYVKSGRRPVSMPSQVVAGGFHYVADCEAWRKPATSGDGGGTVHCGGDFGSASFGGGSDGFGDGNGGDGGGGDGGGGCGSE